jgi:tripartite ATP-independent transporter DctM subunit
MTHFEVGLVGCGVLLVLLASSMPVGFAMGVVGVAGFAYLVSPEAAMSMLASEIHGTFASHSLTVIPLFVLMGQVAFHAGISRRLFDAAYAWLGWLPGGMAMATVGACAGFGAICGSGPATAATMASVALPEMKRYGYDLKLGAGAVAAGGSLGMLIPPSVVFIVYGVLTQQSVGALFLAGIVPGILIAGLFCGMILLLCIRRPHLAPRAKPQSLGSRLLALLGVLETLVLFAVVMGGLALGYFTPTEAAAIGAAGSLGIALLKRRLRPNVLVQSLKETARTSCMVMVIVAGAVIFGRFLAITHIPDRLAGWLTSLEVAGWMVMSLIVLFFLFSGCFVDALALVLLTVPVFEPVVSGLGYDPIWFGVIIVVVTQMGVISPPVGVCVYVVSGIERDLPLQSVFKGALPFLLALVAAAALLLAFPQITLFLPNWVRQATLGG